jgi:uncharacterized protein YycO
VKEITWRLQRGLSLTSTLIGWFGRGYYSHIDVVTPTGKLRGSRSDIIAGVAPGYRDRPYPYEEAARATLFTVTVADDQHAKYWDFSDRQLGVPYDTHGLFDTYILGRDWRDDGQWWCSEEVAANLEYAGIIDQLPDNLKSVSPGDCARILEGLRAKVREDACGIRS